MDLISILRELIQKQNGKRHRRHLSACIPAQLISAAKRRPGALEIFQNRAEKVLDRADATHKHPHENVRHEQRRTQQLLRSSNSNRHQEERPGKSFRHVNCHG